MLTIPLYGSGFYVTGSHLPKVSEALRQLDFTVTSGSQNLKPLGHFEVKQTDSARFVLFRDKHSVCEACSFAFMVEKLLAELRRESCEMQAQRTFIKGDCFRLPSGRAIVCVGSDFSGQSYLASTMSERPGTLWSRHFVVVNDKGELEPFPCPDKNPKSIAPAAIVLSTFVPGTTIELHSISAGELAMRLVPLVLNGTEKMSLALAQISAMASLTPHRLTGVRGEAASVVTALEKLNIW